MPTTEQATSLSAEQQGELEKRLRQTARDNRLPCAAALALAKALNIPTVEVGKAANKLNIKICNCQLGCF